MELNLNHLEIFRAVAAHGSISRGAEHLLISQPAVSKQVAVLERAVGAALLERLPRGVRLTQAGEILAGYADRIFGLREEARAAIEEYLGLRCGRLRIGGSTSISVYVLPELIVRFRQRFPNIQTHLEVARSGDIEKRLIDGGLDIGFTELFSGTELLRSEVFHTDELVAIAKPTHPLVRKRRITPEQLCREAFVVRDPGSDTTSFVERALLAKGLEVKPVMSLGTTEAIKRAVAAGIGVAIVSRLAIDLELKARRLAVLSVHGLSIRRPLYRLWRPIPRGNPAVQEFARLLN